MLHVFVNTCMTEEDKQQQQLRTTYMRFGPRDPRLQKEREPRLVEPAGGLHSYVDVLQLQLGGQSNSWTVRHCAPDRMLGLSSAAGHGALRVLGGGLLDEAARRVWCRGPIHAHSGKAARA